MADLGAGLGVEGLRDQVHERSRAPDVAVRDLAQALQLDVHRRLRPQLLGGRQVPQRVRGKHPLVRAVGVPVDVRLQEGKVRV